MNGFLSRVNNVFLWFRKTKPGQSIILSLLILVGMTGVGAFSLITMYKMANRVYVPLMQSNELKQKFMLTDNSKKDMEIPKLEYLKLQYKSIELHKAHHKELGKIYYANYYTFSIILAVSSIISAILIFFLAGTGWKDAHYLLKTAFFCFFAISTFFGIMTVTLDQKENYQDNFGQYLYFDKIQNNILTFANTSGDCDSIHSRCRVDSFIIALNNDLKSNNQFFITIDASKISLDDISGKLGKAVNGSKALNK